MVTTDAHYIGRWCFDASVRGMRGYPMEVVCAYGDALENYYVEWQYDAHKKQYYLYYTCYSDFIFLQHAKIALTANTYQELVEYCMWLS